MTNMDHTKKRTSEGGLESEAGAQWSVVRVSGQG